MGSKDLKEAHDKAVARKKLLKTPIPMRPDAPENIRLSKKEFIAKRRAEKEEEVKVAEYRQKLRAEKNAPAPEEIEDAKEEKEEKKVLRGRPKKVE